MSSTYSTNLAIELMGAGDQAGNWGSTTNTNLGTLIEQAISGYTSYSCSGGTDTLPMTQGASATARNMYIRLYNAGGGTIVVPATPKLYYIYNNTSSGAVTVQASGGSGISVPNGARMSLFCTGAAVIQASDTFASATLSSPTLTGTPVAPTAAAGTNTTQIATTAFVTSALVAAYPIGSIYMSTVSTNPSSLLGFGTWVAFGAGRMLISQDGATYAAGSTGGSATTTLITANLPAHNHTATSTVTDPGHTHTSNAQQQNTGHQLAGGGSFTVYPTPATINSATTGISVSTSIGNTGSGTAATTISPYIAVYMWNRTA